MRYLGGKSKTAKEISDILYQYSDNTRGFIDLMCGSAKITETFIKRYKEKLQPLYTFQAYDINPYLIALLTEVSQSTFDYPLPFSINKAKYHEILSSEHIDDNPALSAFVGFGLSFGGKWKGGPVPLEDKKRDYVGETARSLQKQAPYLKFATFDTQDYKSLFCNEYLIYADPPYKGTTKYKYANDFSHEDFWNKIRELSQNNVVIISEYEAPSDFDVIWTKEIKTDLHNSRSDMNKRTEKLFKYRF